MARISRILGALIPALLLCACSTTRRIPADEQLYNGIKKISYTAAPGQKVPGELKSDISEAVSVKPNNPWPMTNIRAPFPLGLWVYNNWPNPPKGFKHWIYNKLVAEPVLVSDVRPDLRVKMVDEILRNNGYFRSSVDYSVIPKRNRKIAWVSYDIHTGPLYHVDSLELLPDTCVFNHLVDSLVRRTPYFRRLGAGYNVDSLASVRRRVADGLRNRGYYFFKPEYIEYLADSTINPGAVAIRVAISATTPEWAMRRYKVGNVTTRVMRNRGGGHPDTIPTNRGTLIQMKPSRFRRQLVDECVMLRRGRYIGQWAINGTQTRFARLGIFNAININVEPDSAQIARGELDVDINCTFDSPLEASIEANVSSKSNSYIGPGVTLGLTNRNIFGGGEQLSVQLTGSYEWQTGRARSNVFNSYEIGLKGSLSIPRLLAPKFIPRLRRDLSWTRVGLQADLLNRPKFFRMAQFNASYGYSWPSSRYSTNDLTLLKLTYTKLLNTTNAFDSLMTANPAIAQSFRSQFMPQLSYTYTYDRTWGSRDVLTVTASAQEAGAVFCGLWSLCGSHGEKKLFGIPISQFVKGSFQIVYGHRYGRWQNWLMWRVAVGAAHAYGNSSQVPYSEQFWVGGANSIRAFTVRSIGPGSYHDRSSVKGDYFDQTGTFKFEANVEYRFPIVGPLHGALFIDTGNVWLLKSDPDRPGGKLRGKTFLNELALGTGAGLRVDIGMLVIRGDLGIGIHAPYDTGRSGYYNMTSFRNSLAFHLAIGYPF
ncbi:MAG: BamA/TamA family outer membrane protein [Muribaculaceae bacterium]|nr:BamA/TamA family outer membrane protein [Muribaculaceae bacterium]